MEELERASRIEKLPQWAQSYIARLESDIAHLRQEIADMTGDESPIWHTPDYQTKLHLPKRTTVVFALEGGELEFNLRQGTVICRANGVGHWYPYILPDATNTFTIGLKER